jgi:putative flippase GtrA
MYKKKLLIQTAKFIITGFINTFIDFFILNTGMLITGISSGYRLILLNTVSFSCALINSYFMNKYWTFSSKDAGNKFPGYLLVSLFSMAVNNTVVYLFTDFCISPYSVSPQLWVNTAKITATFVSFICNFLGYKYFVFKSSNKRKTDRTKKTH